MRILHCAAVGRLDAPLVGSEVDFLCSLVNFTISRYILVCSKIVCDFSGFFLHFYVSSKVKTVSASINSNKEDFCGISLCFKGDYTSTGVQNDWLVYGETDPGESICTYRAGHSFQDLRCSE